MGKFDYKMPEELQRQLRDLSGDKFDRIAPKMIEAALPIVEASVKAKLTVHSRSGDLVDSVKKSKVSHKNGVFYGRVGFDGYGNHKYKSKTQKVANVQKAMALEYGTSKQAAHPFLEAATNDANSKAVDIMQAIFNEELEK